MADYEYKVVIGGVTYGMDKIVSGWMHTALFDTPSVGNTCSAEIELVMWDIAAPAKGAQIIPYMRKVGDANWLQKGVFLIDWRKIDNYIDELITLHGFDLMRTAEVEFLPDVVSVNWPYPMDDAVDYIAQIMGVNIDARTVLNHAFELVYPNDKTCREVLGEIAAAHGGNWIMTDAGELLLVPLATSAPAPTHYLVDENGNPIVFGEKRILI